MNASASSPTDPNPQAPADTAPRPPHKQPGRRRQQPAAQGAAPSVPADQHPVLIQLAARYPALFGDKPLPLKRGIYEDLMAAQDGALVADDLKAALALHTRSTRYLGAVAAGLARHNLDAQAVEQPTPEQVHHALIEVFRRRLRRTRSDLRPELRQRILQAYEASGLDRETYAQRVHGRDEEVNELTRDALAEAARREARDEALLRTFVASGQSEAAFADMYGLLPAEVQATLARARSRQTPPAAGSAPEHPAQVEGAVNTVSTPV